MYSLYLKTHQITNLKYLGYTKRDPVKYVGSGKYWTRHLKEHGRLIKTEILFVSDMMSEIKIKGEYYSRLWDIVESEEFANLKEESGCGGSGFISWDEEIRTKVANYWNKENREKVGKRSREIVRTDSWKDNIRKSLKGKPLTKERREKISKSLKGRKISNTEVWTKQRWYFNPDSNEVIRIHMDKIPPDGFISGRGSLKKK